MNWRLFLGITVGLLGIARPAQAILFDAADVLEQGKFAVGIDGELLLSDPSSEGIEARVKYALSNSFNSEAYIGNGSDYRKFRLGESNTLSIYPDAEGQIGVAAVFGVLYLKRYDTGAFQFNAGPMIHKKFTDWTVPFNAFVGLPLALELSNGHYFTGSTITIGGILEWPAFEVPVEVGLGIGRMESYLAAGAMVRF